ncbi:LysE family translocator [Ciceribacter sp. L1K22]|uniref:LysE family translocator n=1 Tax=Ciceribacter sp. L1K22 TaxID=2820275 RepID=UPI001ABDB7E3|nr:LysE family translocator [Ciceribacter sp. L1K22]MBO3761289.1 LysE family translocator [Ciceribacter sp. L1K22]
MIEVIYHWPQLASAYLVYLIAVLSAGPATLAIASTSLSHGRRHGITIAAGIFCGSMTWAIAASLGLAAVLSHYAQALVLMRILGGLYLLYLAWRAFRSAASSTNRLSVANARISLKGVFLKGYAIHITNPKAIFAWLAIISLGLPAEATSAAVVSVVCGCLITGFTVFMGYAMLFSTPGALRTYDAARRYIDGTLAVFFTFAGFKLLMAR